MEGFSGAVRDDERRERARYVTKAEANRAIGERLAKQAGLIGYDQLKEIGLSAARIASRVESGELHLRTEPPPAGRPRAKTKSGRPRLSSGSVLAPHSGPLLGDGLLWRALLSAPQSSRVGALSSCFLHDLVRRSGSTVHILHPGGSWEPPRGVMGRRTDHLPESDLASKRGLPCLTVARSVIDAAEHGTAEVVDDLLDRTVELQIYDEVAMRRVIKEREAFGGAEPLANALARLDDKSGEFRSKFERKVTRLVQTSRLIPSPVVNALLHGFRPDLGWIGTRAIVECDGRDYHRSLADRLADEERETILYSLGFEFLRLRWKDVQYERERTLERIERFVLANLDPPVPRG